MLCAVCWGCVRLLCAVRGDFPSRKQGVVGDPWIGLNYYGGQINYERLNLNTGSYVYSRDRHHCLGPHYSTYRVRGQRTYQVPGRLQEGKDGGGLPAGSEGGRERERDGASTRVST